MSEAIQMDETIKIKQNNSGKLKCWLRNLEEDGCQSKENLFGQSASLMNVTYIVFPWGDQ